LASAQLYPPISAQSYFRPGPYIEGVYVGINYQDPNTNFNDSLGGIRIGVNLTPYLALEGFTASGSNTYGFTYNGTFISTKVSELNAVYVKFSYSLTPDIVVFARAGQATGNFYASQAYTGMWNNGSSFSWGAGAQYSFNPHVYGTVDAMQYYSGNGITVGGPSLSIGYRF
jgi:hypothetical protein